MFVLLLFSGAFFWTLCEYILHRFLGHEHKGKNFFKSEHQLHHSKFNYFAPFYKKAIASIVVSTILFIVLNLFLSPLNAFAFVFGFTSMYFLYESTHFRYHSVEPIIKPFILLRKHHFYHHFHNPKVNHGVTTRLWDRVFGTFECVEKVRVPKSMIMDWLVEENKVKDKYSKHFHLNVR
jgi:sterol desaturase/sphingolipid hydroxylase (fatty acid hydroxylase superfamily)